ncbi:aspartyl/glutamyl-tRNA amidotransferase subunit A [Fructilactobacillus lindneri]|uniref:Glutamyl-tRNA(Gln) amidotransferase subunit A n=2 Tax=Fructilactobacillus lindneri TaxID=53444 RepID=A0A0R2JN55_9LACO|nr:Asp-tRNA(Asn)/Glu-tRNA(Gln) amidotransferase subunit GatA [Fructilactobacillus lindneri]ANZ57963.1 aspartyl/glutamyl-tRNA amidotransferase subunit A [Fructilactobacillus lindneri]ANZ59233.1 aspartyl/glutamyl-tRNA amidotransferase subunit A [Fructilactobacillus lindneri]KRN78562.1 glutamyl-tRNA(Gln) amidotransferase subunit A [Fructilactobacillus lindneri DSM 20690 = JCM 11027]POG98284.1 aspartyl/glutamyl-tRNA amidotransferase subunit A [Fructilactobacillus lindneri]POH01599.1 aspartyl/gluta
MNYFDNDLESVHQQLVNGDITSEELTKQTIDKINSEADDIQAYLSMNDQAIEKAKAIDAAGIDPDNIFSGMPIAIKDNIVTKNMKTTAASKMLENFTSVYDATVVEKLEKAGAVIVGKTNLDEFAMGSSTEKSAFKTTRNPWNLDTVPGGSSGGSAATVSAGEVPVSLGSDTGGSIRQPASFTGVVGLKPTYGRVSRWGLIAFGSSFDQIGPLTNNVKDNAHMLNAIAGHDEHDATSSKKEVPDFTEHIDAGVKGLRIALPKEYLGEGVDPEIKTAIKQAAETYQKLGATVDEVSLPNSKYGVMAYYVLASSEASSNLERFDGVRYGYRADGVKNLEDLYVKTRSTGFGNEVKRRIMLGTFSLSAGSFDRYFKQAAKIRTIILNDFQKVFKDHDLIMGPTTPTTAFKVGTESTDPTEMYTNDTLTIPVNLAGLPGMSLPAGFSKGLPIGMQLIGRPFDESTIYQAGYAFEQNTDFHKEKPQLGGK